MKWIFKKVTLKDSKIILRWRNSPEIYRYLFSARPVSQEEHDAWLKRALVNPAVLFLMGYYKDHPAGTVRFDLADDKMSVEVGIYLAPELHGKGLSVEMLQESEKVLKEEFRSVAKIIAKVLPENRASEKMFKKTGYSKKFIQLEKRLEK